VKIGFETNFSAKKISIMDNGLYLPGSTGGGASKEAKIEKWWEVNRKSDPPLTRGATPLVERCMRVYGWNEGFTKRCLRGYRQFMELKSVMNDWQETKLYAPSAIHQMWEQHILDNLNYTDDCFLLFGRVIGHDPDAILNERVVYDRVKTTKIAFQARYGNDLDPEVWDYGQPEIDTIAVEGNDVIVNDHHGHHHHHIGNEPSTPRGMLPVATVARMSTHSPPRGRQMILTTPGHNNNDLHDRAPSIERGGSIVNDRDVVVGRRSGDDKQSSVDRGSLVNRDSLTDRTSGTNGGLSRSHSPPPNATTTRTRSLSKGPRSPKSPTGNDPITIFLRDTNSGEETYFSLRYRSTLRIVFTVFAERKGLSQDNLKFSYNNQVLTGYETPYSLGLEDRARIDVQIGGRRA
jgi:Ubiquitin-2 like Rad60 SUMO-like